MSGKSFILIVVGLVVLGALLNRDYPAAGLAATLVALAFYLLGTVRRTVACLLRFRSMPRRRQARAVISVAVLSLLLSAWFSGAVSYFMLLVLLAADYMMYDTPGAESHDEKTPPVTFFGEIFAYCHFLVTFAPLKLTHRRTMAHSSIG